MTIFPSWSVRRVLQRLAALQPAGGGLQIRQRPFQAAAGAVYLFDDLADFARRLLIFLLGPAQQPLQLSRDLAHYLAYYNTERAHTGRLTQGRTPYETLIGARKMRPR